MSAYKLILVVVFLLIGVFATEKCPENTPEECIDGSCIAESQICDGTKDCPDGSDEYDCDYKLCRSPAWFRCDNSRCISAAVLCDGDDDCGDWSDEKKGCELHKKQALPKSFHQPCKSDEWRCTDGFCINKSVRCNGHSDCPDESDEQNCDSIHKHEPNKWWKDKCHESAFVCANGECIPGGWKCDGSYDCEDGSDEFLPMCEKFTSADGRCTKIQWECKDKSCILKSKLCNGKRDCPDGSDEEHCASFTAAETDEKLCREDEWECEDGFCIFKNWLCNGEENCPDGSDEKNCATNPRSHFSEKRKCTTTEWRCADGTCIHEDWMCNGHPDCPDKSDEMGCETTISSEIQRDNKTCKKDEWRCVDGFCIPKEWVCDGKHDCPDFSDEEPHCIPAACDGFRCTTSHECIMSLARCDGTVDCNDGSDEINCTNTKSYTPKLEECTVTNRHFMCKDGVTCLPLTEYCNNRTTCLDGGDEGGLCNTPMCKSAKCSHECQATPKGPLCLCPKGFELAPGSNTNCKDINECNTFGICDQHCINTKGSYKCVCDRGYSMINSTCIADGDDNAILVMAVYSNIRLLSLRSEHLVQIKRSDQRITGVMFDGTYVYWTSLKENRERISRMRTNGGNEEDVVTAGVGLPEDLAFDWVTKKIYFTDAMYKHIAACSYDGHACAILVNTITDFPRGISVVPQNRMMYWADWGSRPHIARAGMDGSNAHILISEKLLWPNSVSVDYSNGRIYWADAKFHTLESATLDGSDRRMIKASVRNPFSIAVFENRLYWSDDEGREIQSCDKFTGKFPDSVIRSRKRRILGISIYHPSLQPSLPNPCELTLCSHLCFLSPNSTQSYICKCPEGMYLTETGRTCKEKEHQPFILVGSASKLFMVKPQTLGRQHIVEVPLQTITHIGALTYNYLNKAIIMSDHYLRNLVSLDLEKMQLTTLLDSNIGFIRALEYDDSGYNVYWCDDKLHTIEVLSLTTHERAIVLRDVDGHYPISLAIVPTEDKMFVGFTDDTTHFIDLVTFDGKKRQRVISDLQGRPVAITLYHDLKKIFWVDDKYGYIECADYKGGKRMVWQSEFGESISIALVGNKMFFSNKVSPYLHWAAIDEGKVSAIKIDIDEYTSMSLLSVSYRLDKHDCQTRNGGCSHVCHAMKSGPVCACPEGMHLKGDGKTCIQRIQCRPHEFLCIKDDMCIDSKNRCNGHKECPSGEDESFCDASLCDEGYFKCASGECILMKLVCDGHDDCKDSSDENTCDKRRICEKNGQFACKSGECLDRRYICDGVPQCRDKSDEENCDSQKCDKNEFQCLSGHCIPNSWECDDTLDCADGSDEHQGCASLKCNADEFKCANGKCIDRELFCDGEDDCGDGSDEHCDRNSSKKNNQTVSCDPEKNFICAQSPHICLPLSARCNHSVECPYGDDEMNCVCPDLMFMCRSDGKCIERSWKCDGYKDCSDGSDELGCHKNQTAVRVDCIDSEYKCSSGECLSFIEVCDGKKDCKDGSDEGGKCAKACTEGNHRCVHTCLATPNGAICKCHEGYTIDDNKYSCNDIDECKGGVKNPCSQLCINTPGSFLCGCSKGYMLRLDRRACKAEGSPVAAVFATHEEIRRLVFRTGHLDVLASYKGLIVSGIAVNTHKQNVYYSSGISSRITRLSTINGMEKHLDNVVERPQKMTVDWSTDNVYVVDNVHYPVIQVCNMELSRCAKIITAEGASYISGIVVDPTQGNLFWSTVMLRFNQKGFSEIWRSGLDGNNPTKIISKSLVLVSSLELDIARGQLVWTDQSRGIIEAANLKGYHRKQTFVKQVPHPQSVVVFENYLYLLSSGSGKLTRCTINYPHECEHVELHAYDMSHYVLMQPVLQPLMPNACDNITCNHLCVKMSVTRARCICETGATCDDLASTKLSSSASNGLVIFLVLLTLAAVSFMVFYFVVYKKKNKGKLDLTLSFQNKTFGCPQNAELGAINPIPLQDESQHQYANPLYRSAMNAAEKIQKTVLKFTASAPPKETLVNETQQTYPLDSHVSPANSDDEEPEYENLNTNYKCQLIPADK